MKKHICPKSETESLLRQICREKTCDITISLLTDTDYARNNGWQDEIDGVDMNVNDIIIVMTNGEYPNAKANEIP